MSQLSTEELGPALGRGLLSSIIKAGLTAVGRPSSRVRPPLTDLTDAELAELTTLVKTIA